jgi:hypothetical protein
MRTGEQGEDSGNRAFKRVVNVYYVTTVNLFNSSVITSTRD